MGLFSCFIIKQLLKISQAKGLRERARELAEHNAQALEKRGFETLIVDCPECYRAFKEFYPVWGQLSRQKLFILPMDTI